MEGAMRRLTAAYRATAIIILNVVVVFASLNILAGIAFAVKSAIAVRNQNDAPPGKFFKPDGAPVDNHHRTRGQLRYFDYNACNELEQSYVADVLDDFFDLNRMGFRYQPWVQFSEPPFQGKRVSVQTDEIGIPLRGTTNPSDRPSGRIVRIYVFGGSTTFGYQVSDEHTWPSHLSRILNERAGQDGLNTRIEVRNYGRGFYYPSQEVALLVDLLRSGHRPNLVVFLDGLNVGFFQDVPHFSANIAQAVHVMQHGLTDWSKISSLQLKWLPAWQLARWVRRALGDHGSDEERGMEGQTDEPHTMAALFATRFEEDWRIAQRVAGLYGVKTLVFIQPNALVNYPPELYRTPPDAGFLRARALATLLYERLRRVNDAVYLGNLFEEWGSKRKALIDHGHYSPGFNELVARRIASHINLRALDGSTSRSAVDPARATGVSREGGFPTWSPLL
jgi:hypothetical protein